MRNYSFISLLFSLLLQFFKESWTRDEQGYFGISKLHSLIYIKNFKLFNLAIVTFFSHVLKDHY